MGVVGVGAAADRAQALAARLGVPLWQALPEGDAAGLCVVVDDSGAALQLLAPRAPGPVRVAFDDPALRHRRRGGHNELLGRAIGWRSQRAPQVLDATAGFGRDAFTLGDLGCEVTLCEREPVMAALLDDALAQARDGTDAWLQRVAGHLHLHAGDARQLPAETLARCDAIYLDPMFPAQRRALPGKEMQVLQALVEGTPGDDDGADLLAWALAADVPRVVVKRPRRAPPLAGAAPGFAITGRAVRFDVYPRRGARPHNEEEIACS